MADATPTDLESNRPPEAVRLTQRLRRSSGFRLLERALLDALLILDPEETVVYAGEGVEDVLGVPPEQIVGRPFRELIRPEDLKGLPPGSLGSEGTWEVRFASTAPDQWTSLAARDPSGLGDDDGDVLNQLDGHVLLFARPLGRDRVSQDRLDLFRRALDATNNLVVVADAQQEDQPLIFVNQHFLDATGYEREEVIGRNCRFLQVRADGTRDDDQEGLRKLRRCLAADEAVHVRLRNYTKAGGLFWNDLFVTPIRNAEGTVTHYVGVQNDVTDQVETDGRLAASAEARTLRNFYDRAPLPAGLLALGADGALRVRSANAAAVTFLGLPAEPTGQTLESVGVPAPDAARWRAEAGACFETGEVIRFRMERPQNGALLPNDPRPFDVVLIPVDADHVSFVLENATGRAAAEDRQAELVAALEQAADTVIITDGALDEPGPVIRYVNEAFVQMTGYTRDEAVGRTPHFMQGRLTSRAALDRLRQRLERGLPYHGELVNVRKDGTPYVAEIEIMPIRDQTGAVVRFVSTQRDVTERRRLEAEVLGATTRAQAEIARDLHDGVGQVLAGTAFLLHGLSTDLSAEGSAFASQVARAAALVQQAQQEARALAHGLFPVAVTGDRLLMELEGLAEKTARAHGVVCEVTCRSPLSVAPDDRAADLYRIAQEAVANAVRHSRASRILLCLDPPNDGEDSGDGLASLAIEDNGVGMSEDQADAGGVGLNMMRYRARRLGGSLHVLHAPGGGTVIQVRFPLHAEAVLPSASPRFRDAAGRVARRVP